MIELELTAVESMPASNFAPAQIDLLHVRFDHVDVAQDAAQRVYDVATGKIARATSCNIGVNRMKFSRAMIVTLMSGRRARWLSRYFGA